MSFTLAQLLTPETQATIRARLVANLIAAGFPLADWAPTAAGGIENSLLDAVAGTLARYTGDLAKKIAALRFLDFATGDSLSYLASTFYGITRIPGASTRLSIRLNSTPDAPPYQISPGQLHFQGLTGNRYVSDNADTIQLPPGGSVFITAIAEAPGAAYAEPDKSINSVTNPVAMVTPLPGVDCLNIPTSDFTAPLLIGDSAGSLSATFVDPATPPSFASVIIRATASGNLGTGAWDFSLDNGVTWTSGGPFIFGRNIGGPTGAVLYFQNAPGVSPSFLAGDFWTFQVATSTIVQGNDTETDVALAARCRARWPSLSDVPTESKIGLWARQASSQVGQLIADADPNVSGQVIAIIAAANGAVGSTTAAEVQNYTEQRLKGYRDLPTIRESIVVLPATPHPIVPLGQVLVPRKSLEAVQTASLAGWLTYLASVRIGGTVQLSELVQIIMDAGAIATENLVLTGGTPNVKLGPTEIATPPADGTSILTSLAWVPQ